MPTDIHQTQSGGTGGNVSSEDDFISLRDILAMILRHRWPIAIVVLVVTVAAGIFFLMQPRVYQAEGYLQVIAPVSLEGNVDKNLFETMIISHLQRASSAFLAKNVAAVLKTDGIDITPLELSRKIKITRPPKTDLIRLVAGEKSSDNALLIVRHWISLYQVSVQKNNIRAALSQIHLLLKKSQSDTMEKQAAVDKLKSQADQTASLVTVSRSVDDRQLWSDLAQKVPPDSEALKKLSEIHIKGQEQSAEYINLKITLNNAEQLLSTALAKRTFYQDVEQMLDARASANGNDKVKKSEGSAKGSEAELYVQTILKSSDIIQFGEPGLISAKRGALKNTVLAFVVVLFLSCFCAFLYEWGKGILSSR